MNLRSGSTTTIFDRQKQQQRRRQINMDKQKKAAATAAAAAATEDPSDMRQLLLEMKNSITSEIQGFRSEFKTYCEKTDKDMQRIIDQTAELRLKAEQTEARVEEMENRVGEIHDSTIAHEQTIKQLKKKLLAMEIEMDYLESKSRQNSIRIFNVAEKSEQPGDMVGFLTKLFNEQLEIPGEFNIMRAHRVFREGSTTARPIIAAFMNFDVKKNVLHTAWRKKEVLFKGDRIGFDHDLSAKDRQKRTAYKPIREKLLKDNIRSFIIAPAKLKVNNQDGTSTIYSSPEEAAEALERSGSASASEDNNGTEEEGQANTVGPTPDEITPASTEEWNTATH